MKTIENKIKKWNQHACVTGKEIYQNGQDFKSIFDDLNPEIDDVGNLFVCQLSADPFAKHILFEAHRDRIGVCVDQVLDDGFVSAVPCGGIDLSILPGTEFVLHGTRKIPCVACSVPPHLLSNSSRAEDSKTIYLDTGLSHGKDLISVGDVATFSAPLQTLIGSKICCPGLDNTASVVALELAMERLKQSECSNHVHFMFSAGEESGSLGIRSIGKKTEPFIAFVVDVGFGDINGLNTTNCIHLGKGPSVSFSDTISRKATEFVIDIAKRENIPLQIIAEPGNTGTSATALQLQNGGIPCALISIPLWNMHTPSEIVHPEDIQACADLIFHLACAKDWRKIQNVE